MKKILTIPAIACIAISATVSSCKKDKTTTPAPTTPGTTATTTPSPNIGGVDGALVSLRTSVSTVTAGIPFDVTTETALATFFASTGNNASFVDGGTVSVNSFTLDKQSNNSYLKVPSAGSTTVDLNFDTNSSNWNVGGAGSVPAFTYNDNATFPTFSGTIPETVDRSAGITVSLSGKVNGADSVILFIAAGSKSFYRTVAGTASSVSISASELASFSVVADKSAVLEVVPYRYIIRTQGSKQYVFIKEYAGVKNININ